MKTRIYQDYYKTWIAETEITLSETLDAEGRLLVLTIRTSKDSRGNLVTRGSVSHVKNEGGYSSATHMVFQDFSKEFLSTKPGRVTIKAVEKQHNEVDFVEIIKEAKEFYKLAD